MGRNAQPVKVLQKVGKKHLTKAEIEAREAAEIKLGANDLDKLTPPVFIKNDTVAYKHWQQHIKEYKQAAKAGADILTSADIGVLAMYCKTYSEYESLIRKRDIFELNSNPMIIDDTLKLEAAINKKMDMLIKMQDRLFLNPLAKVKNVPKKEVEKPKNPMEDEFDI